MSDEPTQRDGRPQLQDGDLLEQLLRRREQVAELSRELSAMRASTSWRLTAPLRWLSARVRRPSAPVATPQPALACPLGPAWESERLPITGDESARTVDAIPLLGGLVAEAGLQALHSPPRSGRIQLSGRSGRTPLGFIGSPQLAVELAFDFPVTLFDPDSVEVEASPAMVLIEVSFGPQRHAWTPAFEGDAAQRQRLRKMLEGLRRRRVPVAMWLRVEPEEVERVAALLSGADIVFSTSTETANHVERCGGRSGGVIAGMVQPAIHNPVSTPGLRRASSVLEGACLVDALTDRLQPGCRPPGREGVEVMWTDSFWDLPASRLQDIGHAGTKVLGPVREVDKLALWRAAGGAVFESSPHRPSWWVRSEALRAAACGLPVRVEPALATGLGLPAVSELEFHRWLQPRPDEVCLPAAAWALRASREVTQRHSVRRVMAEVALALDVEGFGDREAPASALLVSQRFELVEAAMARFAAQTHRNRELVVVLHGGGPHDVARCAGAARSLGIEARVSTAASRRGLGECLDQALRDVQDGYWFKWDDDDDYAPHYIADMMRLLQATGAQVGGKPLAFTRFESDARTYFDPGSAALANVLHQGGCEPGHICGATLCGTVDVARRVGFATNRRHGVDSVFLEACREVGTDVLAGDLFGFRCDRSADPSRHTWLGNERAVRARGRVVPEGTHVVEDAS